MGEDDMSVSDAAKSLGVTRSRIHQWVAEGRLKSRKVGPILILSRSEVSRFKDEPRPAGRKKAPPKDSLPNYGEVPCGPPAPEPADGLQPVDWEKIPDVYGPKEGLFCVTAKGRSMVECGILDGDTVVIRQQPTADPGRSVLCVIGRDNVAVKRYAVKRAKPMFVWCDGTNKEHVIGDGDRIVGVVVGVVRKC